MQNVSDKTLELILLATDGKIGSIAPNRTILGSDEEPVPLAQGRGTANIYLAADEDKTPFRTAHQKADMTEKPPSLRKPRIRGSRRDAVDFHGGSKLLRKTARKLKEDETAGLRHLQSVGIRNR
jgi:hypothetical protein